MRAALSLVALAVLGSACSHPDTPPLPPPTTAAPPSSTTTAASDPPAKAAKDAVPNAPVAKPAAAGALGSDSFTRSLFGTVGKAEKSNFSIAGGNLRDALVAVALGAKGKTAEELGKVLSLPSAPADIEAEAKRERAVWHEAMGDAELVVAARLWHDATQKLAPEYAAQAKEVLGAEPQGVDFLGKPDAARKSINDWAKDKTAGKITELLAAGSIDARTRLVATSALYFKAPWQNAFVESQTQPAPFTRGKTVKQVPTMHRRMQVRSATQPGHVAVDLPYSKSGISMLVVATTSATGSTAELEEKFGSQGLAGLQEGLELVDANVALPKFGFRAGGSMIPALKSMGLKEPFGRSADFSGLFGASKEPLGISDVVQRTFIAVDEKGTEAAAASAVVVSIRSAPMGQPREVKIDRPFLFFLHDSAGHVLFAGRVADPTTAP